MSEKQGRRCLSECGSQNESEIKVDDFAAAALFHFGMCLLAQASKGGMKTKKRMQTQSSLPDCSKKMICQENESFSSAGKAPEGRPISLSSG